MASFMNLPCPPPTQHPAQCLAQRDPSEHLWKRQDAPTNTTPGHLLGASQESGPPEKIPIEGERHEKVGEEEEAKSGGAEKRARGWATAPQSPMQEGGLSEG